jgi:1-acyl-sn-glycerol-3-phosphate acyltransferase
MYSSLLLKMHIRKQASLPECPKIFVANHPSATDPFMLHLACRQPLRVMITKSAFDTPLFGWYLRKTRQIPVPKEQGGVALENARLALESGHSVGIFIEGAISPQKGGFHPPRTGAARLALMTGVPVVPVGIYLHRSWNFRIASRISGANTEGYWYLFGPYAMTVGQPMDIQGDVNDREYVRTVSDTIMERVRALAHESEKYIRPLRLVSNLA